MLTIVHMIEHKKIKHLVFEVNQDYTLLCTQEECPYWNKYQKDCDSEEILELDSDKLVELLTSRHLNPRLSK